MALSEGDELSDFPDPIAWKLMLKLHIVRFHIKQDPYEYMLYTRALVVSHHNMISISCIIQSSYRQ